MDDAADYMENQSRWNNLRADGEAHVKLKGVVVNDDSDYAPRSEDEECLSDESPYLGNKMDTASSSAETKNVAVVTISYLG